MHTNVESSLNITVFLLKHTACMPASASLLVDVECAAAYIEASGAGSGMLPSMVKPLSNWYTTTKWSYGVHGDEVFLICFDYFYLSLSLGLEAYVVLVTPAI